MSSITIDDRDPSIQVDSNVWFKRQEDNAFMGSLTLTDMNGATATVPFKGTSIQVFGAMFGGAGSSYSVDGSPPVSFQRDIDKAPYTVFKQLLYTSSELLDGDHTLVITNLSDEFALALDSLVIKSAAPPPSPPIVTSPATPTTVTTKILTTVVSVSNMISAGTTASFTVSSGSRSFGSTGAPTQSATISSSLISVLPLPATSESEPSTSSPSSSTESPLPPPPSGSHRKHITTGTIIGLSVGSFIAMASVLLFVYCWRRRRKQREYSTRPHPLPHPDSQTHLLTTQPSPPSSASNHSPPLLSEKSQLRAREAGRDPGSAQVWNLARANNALPTAERNTINYSHPITQREEGRDTIAALSHLALASTSSSNTAVAENLVGTARRKQKGAATTSLRMGLSPLRDLILNNDQSELPPEAVSINVGGAESTMGTSSAMGRSNLSSLHQRTTSLSVFDGPVDHDGRGGNNGRRDEAASVFDEPPPYPDTARWSRRFNN